MKKPPKSPSLSVEELSRLLECAFEGEGKTPIQGVSSLEKANKGDLVFLAARKYLPLLEKSEASAAIIPVEMKYVRIPVLKSENPYRTFIKAVDLFYKPYRPTQGIHLQALVSSSTKIAKDVSVGPFTYIGDDVEIGSGTVIFPLVSIYPRVKIGQKVLIHSHVSIREETKIGNRVIIHNGAVIGSDGFGYVKAEDGSPIKIPQKGIVRIEDDVEVGANTTIDRAALGETIIRRGTKIDNLVQIAHNVEIGENTVLASQTGIAGSTKVGKNVIMGGQVGVADHVTIGDTVIVAARTGIAKSIPSNSFVAGTPHMDIKEARKAWVLLPQLYDLFKDVKALKKKLEELEKKIKD